MKFGRMLAEMYQRRLELDKLLKRRSFFLLGPRQTGKSTLIQQTFPLARFYNLLEANTFRMLSANPELIREQLTEADEVIVIDEIQKLPSLLDEVQLLMLRNKRLRFVLTGSSARKLRRGGVNLLAGRAWFAHLHPLISAENPVTTLERRLLYGGLPAVVDSDSP